MALNINDVAVGSTNYIDGVLLERVNCNGVEVWKRIEIGAYMTLKIPSVQQNTWTITIPLSLSSQTSGQQTFTFSNGKLNVNIPCKVKFDISFNAEAHTSHEGWTAELDMYIKRERNGTTSDVASQHFAPPYNAKNFSMSKTIDVNKGDSFYLYSVSKDVGTSFNSLTFKATVIG